jgi:predicted nucleotidyltransferase component of viral defense system
MIDYFRAVKLSEKFGVPIETIEKDFLIEFMLHYIADNNYLCSELIFRGGTALKKIYFPDYRFSEDLDFVIKSRNGLKKVKCKITELIQEANKFPVELDINKSSEYKKDRIQIFLNYNLIDEIKAVKLLKMDFNADTLIPAYKVRPVMFTYDEINGTRGIKTYNPESFACDKIGRILDVVNEPRDIYDLWYLLKQEKISTEKVNVEYKLKYSYKIIKVNLIEQITRDVYRMNWENRLKHQVRNLPDYDKVIDDLKGIISSSFV